MIGFVHLWCLTKENLNIILYWEKRPTAFGSMHMISWHKSVSSSDNRNTQQLWNGDNFSFEQSFRPLGRYPIFALNRLRMWKKQQFFVIVVTNMIT